MRSVSSGMLRKGSFLATAPPLSSEAMYSAAPEAAQTTEPGACPAEELGASGSAASLLAGDDPAAAAEAGDVPGAASVASCTSGGCIQVITAVRASGEGDAACRQSRVGSRCASQLGRL